MKRNPMFTIILFMLLFMMVAPLSVMGITVQKNAQDSAGNFLFIVYSPIDYYKSSATPINVSFQALSSVGVFYNQSTVLCYYNVFNSSEEMIQQGNLTQHPNGKTLYFSLNSTQSQVNGHYYYFVNCLGYGAEARSAFVSKDFYITPNGLPKEQTTSDFSLGIFILLPMLFAFFLIKSASSFSDDHDTLRIFLFLLGSLMILLSFHFSLITITNIYGFTELQNLIGTTTYWTAWVLGAIIMYFLIYILYSWFTMMGKRKEEKLNY